MFTGIVEGMGEVLGVERAEGRFRLRIGAAPFADPFPAGSSIAVNGVCLTVLETATGRFEADVMPETYDRTNLGRLRPGDRVNLERPLRLIDRLGGHLVTGHVDAVGAIRALTPRENAVELRCEAPPAVRPYLIERGSIAVDGVSLTLVRFDETSFTVSLIPHTRATTTLGLKGVGDRVNLEADLIGKYVARLLAGGEGRDGARGGGFE